MSTEKTTETLECLVNRICGELPNGYEISLKLENGYGGVVLTDCHGNDVELPETAGKTIMDQLLDALNVANGSPVAESDISATEMALRKSWTEQGVPKSRQDELIQDIANKAKPCAMVGPFRIPE